MKSSAFSLMHILMRISSLLSMSHAEAWHTTSRSAGLTNIERASRRSPAAARSRARRRNPRPTLTMSSGVLPLCARSARRCRSRDRRRPRARRADRCCPIPAPTCCRAGRRGSGRSAGCTASPYFSLSLRADVGVERHVERLHFLPQPLGLGGELLGRHVVARAPHRAGVGEAEFLGALRWRCRPCGRNRSSSARRHCRASWSTFRRTAAGVCSRLPISASMSRARDRLAVQRALALAILRLEVGRDRVELGRGARAWSARAGRCRCAGCRACAWCRARARRRAHIWPPRAHI